MKALGYTANKKTKNNDLPAYLPDFIAQDVTYIDFRKLKRIGVTHLLFDLDQTLRKRNAVLVEEQLLSILSEAVSKHGFKQISLATNNRRDIKSFAEPMNAKVFQPYKLKRRTVRKPNKAFFDKILKELDVKPEKVIMIGDKLRFDIMGANRAGMYTLLVNPLGNDYWYDKLIFTRWRDRRRLEKARQRNTKDPETTKERIINAMGQLDIEINSVRKLNVDAKGSQPFLATYKSKRYFVKVATKGTNIADWAFKIFRRIVRRKLEDEVPFLSPKQALQHEAYVTSKAIQAGVRVPAVHGVIDLGDYRFGLVQNFIDAKPLDRLAKSKITEELLREIWKQVKLLHKNNIAHRDLRASNILIEPKARPWIVDFDFATVPATERNITKDNVELLSSIAAKVGAKKSVKYASTVLTPSDFSDMIPMLRYKTLSISTKKDVRQDKELMSQLREFVEVLSASAAAA